MTIFKNQLSVDNFNEIYYILFSNIEERFYHLNYITVKNQDHWVAKKLSKGSFDVDEVHLHRQPRSITYFAKNAKDWFCIKRIGKTLHITASGLDMEPHWLNMLDKENGYVSTAVWGRMSQTKYPPARDIEPCEPVEKPEPPFALSDTVIHDAIVSLTHYSDQHKIAICNAINANSTKHPNEALKLLESALERSKEVEQAFNTITATLEQLLVSRSSNLAPQQLAGTENFFRNLNHHRDTDIKLNNGLMTICDYIFRHKNDDVNDLSDEVTIRVRELITALGLAPNDILNHRTPSEIYQLLLNCTVTQFKEFFKLNY